MQLGAVLDTVIGVAFVFFLLALASSAVAEWVATLLKKRAKYLLRTLRDMLDGPATAPVPATKEQPADAEQPTKTARRKVVRAAVRWEQGLHDEALALMTEGRRAGVHADAARTLGFPTDVTPVAAGAQVVPPMLQYVLTHPLVASQAQTRASGEVTRLPSYLSARTVSTVLLDALVPDSTGRTSVGRLRAKIGDADLPEPLKQSLLAVTRRADATIDDARTEIERWYDTTMDRVTGNYKRWTKRWLLVISAVVVLLVHVDALAMAKTLYTDPAVRSSVVALADQNACQDATDARACAEETREDLTKAGLPIGPSPDCRLDVWGAGTTRWNAATCLVGGPADQVHLGTGLLALLGMALSVLAASFGAPFWFDVLTRASNLRNTGRKPDPSTASD